MYQRYFIAPKESFFLFGPRGFGKSTWIKRLYPDAIYINLLEPNELRYYASYPERLKETLSAYPDKKNYFYRRGAKSARAFITCSFNN